MLQRAGNHRVGVRFKEPEITRMVLFSLVSRFSHDCFCHTLIFNGRVDQTQRCCPKTLLKLSKPNCRCELLDQIISSLHLRWSWIYVLCITMWGFCLMILPEKRDYAWVCCLKEGPVVFCALHDWMKTCYFGFCDAGMLSPFPQVIFQLPDRWRILSLIGPILFLWKS